MELREIPHWVGTVVSRVRAMYWPTFLSTVASSVASWQTVKFSRTCRNFYSKSKHKKPSKEKDGEYVQETQVAER